MPLGRAQEQVQDKPSKSVAPEDHLLGDDLTLGEFMRVKLAFSNRVLEGLCTEDSKMVAEAAAGLNRMSVAERWRVSTDPMYRQFSREFTRTTQQLQDAAKEKNMDRAALKWVSATMSCIECHNYVRGIRIAGESGTSPAE